MSSSSCNHLRNGHPLTQGGLHECLVRAHVAEPEVAVAAINVPDVSGLFLGRERDPLDFNRTKVTNIQLNVSNREKFI